MNIGKSVKGICWRILFARSVGAGGRRMIFTIWKGGLESGWWTAQNFWRFAGSVTNESILGATQAMVRHGQGRTGI